MSYEVTDLFCGGGGSSLGAVKAGATLRFALNHWSVAISNHNRQFQDADHGQVDVKTLSESRIRRYPHSHILIASPECQNHSLAKGAATRKRKMESLLDPEVADLGPSPLDEAERSRTTMNDVCRFAAAKKLAGKPYLGIVVENVVEARVWGRGSDGRYFNRWLNRIRALGYEHEILYINSMFLPPVPQSRDRLYVVFWLSGLTKPDLKLEPESWCARCETVVAGRQTWKRSDREPWGRYGQQYFYTCPSCYQAVIPAIMPAASILDNSVPAPLIGGRSRPLAENTRARIHRGLTRLATEDPSIRLEPNKPPYPLTLPIVPVGDSDQPPAADLVMRTGHKSANGQMSRTVDHPTYALTTTSDLAMVTANTQNAVPRDAAREGVHSLRTEGGLSLILANRMHGVPRAATREPSQTVCTGETLAVLGLQKGGGVKRAGKPSHTPHTGGHHHTVLRDPTLIANYDPGWARDPSRSPAGSVTTQDHHSLLVPYSTKGRAKSIRREPADTVTTENKLSLVVPYSRTSGLRVSADEPVTTVSTRDRLALLVPQPDEPSRNEDRYGGRDPLPEITEEDIDACGFRMFTPGEIAGAMQMTHHPDGRPYELRGNKREINRLFGNAVTPPVMEFIVSRLIQSFDHTGSGNLSAA